MLFERQTFLVAGLSRSGIASAEFLRARDATVFLYDDVDSETVQQARKKLEALGCTSFSKEELERSAAQCDCLVLSPGIPIDHPLAVSFKKAKKRILGEAELGALALRCPAVGVTGTNGKTTTVTMLESILQAAGKNALSCGNVGKPVTSCLEELGENGIAVAEISSFQLETLTSFRPHVAIVLNVTEDHLNRHYTLENYIYLKSRILKNCTESEYAVLNYDDPVVRAFAERTKAQIVWFSASERVEGGYLAEGYFYFHGERVCAEEELSIGGAHNRMNALAAICAAKLFGVENAAIATALNKFRGVKHRLQRLGEIGGVTFIDDSKATNVDSTLKAIKSVRGESVLLLGGKDKGYSYEPLFEELKSSGVVQAVIYGENAFRILNAAVKCGFSAVTLVRPFDLAVRVAFMLAKIGQSVLLSPASASFDCFKSYEERGDRFAQLFKELCAESALKGAAGSEAPTGAIAAQAEEVFEE